MSGGWPVVRSGVAVRSDLRQLAGTWQPSTPRPERTRRSHLAAVRRRLPRLESNTEGLRELSPLLVSKATWTRSRS